MDNIGVDRPASSQARAEPRERQPWQPPELTKETVQAATGTPKLLPILVEVLFVTRATES